MEYNTKRGDLQYREYGRNIKKMIDYVCTIEEPERRGKAVRMVIAMMAQVSGMSLREEVSLRKVWDHLMVMSMFKLEDQWPFEQKDLDELKASLNANDRRPKQRLQYKNSQIERKHYGAYLEAMMRKLKEVPDGEEYTALSTLIVQQAKRSYLAWNGELSGDEIVVNQLVETSGDSRIAEQYNGKGIFVPHGSVPYENSGAQQARKKKKKK